MCYFTTVVKHAELVKNTDSNHRAGEALRVFLEHVPSVRVPNSKAEQPNVSQAVSARRDWVFKVKDQTMTWEIFAEVKNTSHPSRLIGAILRLATLDHPDHQYGVLIVPWMSEKLMNLCLIHKVGCVDLEGNGVLRFGNIFARSVGNPPPKQETQSLKSLFATKATRVLRLMLRDPNRTWRTQPLADTAEVSLGYIHKITEALNERGWLEKTKQGVRLLDPKEVLETWRDTYTPLPTRTFYTLKHGKVLQEALGENNGQHWIYTGFSAADWLAPLVRQPNLHLLADEVGIAQLEHILGFKPVSSGFNLVISFDPEANVIRDRFEAAPSIWTTSFVETYLELTSGNDRSREAAEHLYQERIVPTWETK